ncbi:hypothetical protein [Arthrobacter sp. C9C5]|uniref:hypothetical protein n=1 Tax=Arthrobacter sp. C9C5 TaxID=2735267 RepID=UPI001585148E|nr:hypothetical protein [Arthrobacter sp. C9C5]NUU30839.1 hypothetical protein [Arthrobacter sp. C9C5]
MTKDPLQRLLEKKLGIHIPEHDPDETNARPVALNNDAALAAIALSGGNQLADALRHGLNNTTQENH